MNEYFTDPSHRGGFDAMYYWDQFHPILAAIVILLVGWIIALIVAAENSEGFGVAVRPQRPYLLCE